MKKLALIPLAALLLYSCKEQQNCPFLGEAVELSDPKESYPYAPKEMYRLTACGMDSIDCELALPLTTLLQVKREQEGRKLRYGDIKEAFGHMKKGDEDYYEAARKDTEARRKK
jgi:hypothetical protein